MTYLAIDPGIDTGWAVFDRKGQLRECGVCGVDTLRPLANYAGVIMERPQVYRASRSIGDPNDLITLAITVGKYAERFRNCPVTLVLPCEWKGQLPKKVHHARIRASLPEPEKQIIVALCEKMSDDLSHNALDAVGLGKYAFRMGIFRA